MMKSKIFRFAFSFFCIIALAFAAVPVADAADDVKYVNPDTGYKVVIIDEDDLLNFIEERALVKDMTPLTEYGNIAFWTTGEYTSNEIDQARLKRRSLFGLESGCIFEINRSARKLVIQSYGKINESVTDSKARSITNNVSHYATSNQYYNCSREAFSQILDVCEQKSISEPLKISGYVVISLMLGLIIAIGIAFSKKNNPILQFDELGEDHYRLEGEFSDPVETVYVGQVTDHRPPSSSSGSSGCGSGSSCSSCSSGSSCSSCSSCGGGGCGSGGSSSF